jgi:hypothetical protein
MIMYYVVKGRVLHYDFRPLVRSEFCERTLTVPAVLANSEYEISLQGI